jgi:hypothetical protein
MPDNMRGCHTNIEGMWHLVEKKMAAQTFAQYVA